MENKEAVRTCGKCNKEVAEANFALHETHCNRFLCLCPHCDENVPQDQLSQHREEQHAQVKCSKCNKKMERRHLLEHESEECAERLQECPFCELEVVWKELHEHTVVCGSRTELCRDCGHYVKLRDLPNHSSTCSATDENLSPPQTAASGQDTRSCTRCRGSFPAEEFDQHEQDCFPASRFNYEEAEPEEEEEEESEDNLLGQGGTPQLSSTYKPTFLTHSASRGPWGDGGDPDQISTCPHCHLALPLRTLIWHEVKCRTYIFLKHREA